MIKEKNEHLPFMGSVPTPEEWDEMARDYEHEAVALANKKIVCFIVPRECNALTQYYHTKCKGEGKRGSNKKEKINNINNIKMLE